MLTRIKQVLSAITAKIKDEDRRFINLHLTKCEKKLFWAMYLPDQRHALNVCYTALLLAKNYPEIHQEKLVKCCLLHDVGKVCGDIGTMDKIIVVLLQYFMPGKAARWSAFGKGSSFQNLRHAFYIYFHHAQRSRDKLLALGLVEIARIVSKHHEAPASDDPPELRILRQADNLH